MEHIQNQNIEEFEEGDEVKLNQNEKTTTLYGQARIKFVQKVYTILAMQLLLTSIICIISMTHQSFAIFQINHHWVGILAFVGALISQISIYFCDFGRKFPTNMILLAIFTLCESYLVSFICAITATTSGKEIVIIAAIMTSAMVLGCTIYAFTTKTDFTFLNGLLIIVSIIMIILAIFNFIFRSPFLHMFYCALGVILFGVYLLYDTQMIIGGGRIEITVDDYVLASMCLYVDILQIFIYILDILSQRK